MPIADANSLAGKFRIETVIRNAWGVMTWDWYKDHLADQGKEGHEVPLLAQSHSSSGKNGREVQPQPAIENGFTLRVSALSFA